MPCFIVSERLMCMSRSLFSQKNIKIHIATVCLYGKKYLKLVMRIRKVHGGPVVRAGHFHCRGLGSIPDWGTKIP